MASSLLVAAWDTEERYHRQHHHQQNQADLVLDAVGVGEAVALAAVKVKAVSDAVGVVVVEVVAVEPALKYFICVKKEQRLGRA